LDYNAYVLGRSGRIMKRYDFRAVDDAAALEHARKYVIVSSVEVWQSERLVATLQPEDAC